MVKITDLDMTMPDILYALSEGNPGAATVLMEIAKEYPNEFPLIWLHFDSAGIYGSQIWIEYKDKRNYDIKRLVEDLKSGKNIG